jgi:hypothetical protein
MVYGLDGCPAGARDFSVLHTTQPPIRWALWALSQEVKWQGCEADHSPPSSAEVKNDEAIPPFPHTSSWHGA